MQVVILHNVKSRLFGTDEWKTHSIPVGTKEFKTGKEANEFCELFSKEIEDSDEYCDYIIGNISWKYCPEFEVSKFYEKLNYGVVF